MTPEEAAKLKYDTGRIDGFDPFHKDSICMDYKKFWQLIDYLVKADSDAKKDAGRYRFMRDEDNWGEDSGEDCWSNLGESHALAFDEIVDSRMATQTAESAKPPIVINCNLCGDPIDGIASHNYDGNGNCIPF